MNIRATLVCLQVSAGQMCSRVMHQVKQQMCNGVRKLLPGSGELDEPDEPFEQYTVFAESDPSSYSFLRCRPGVHSFRGRQSHAIL